MRACVPDSDTGNQTPAPSKQHMHMSTCVMRHPPASYHGYIPIYGLCVCMHACMHMRVHTCPHAHVCPHAYIRAWTHMHIWTVCMCVRACMHTCAHMRTECVIHLHHTMHTCVHGAYAYMDCVHACGAYSQYSIMKLT